MAVRTTVASSSASSTAAKLAFGAAGASLILLAALHVLKSDLDPSWHYISEYAIGDNGWIMQLYFLVLALSLGAVLFAVASRLRTLLVKIGLAFGAITVFALVLAALNTIDPVTTAQTQLTDEGKMHGLASTLGNPGFALTALLISIALARNAAWSSARRLILLVGNLPWISIVVMFAAMGIGLSQTDGKFGPDVLIGWPNRFVVLTYALWIMIAAWQVIKPGNSVK